MDGVKALIESGKTVLGVEFGSTRVKAVLIDENYRPIASGNYQWENRLENGIWTYSLEDIRTGLQESYKNMAADAEKKYGATITTIGAIGFSAMMHGYIALDKNDNLLVPFRTWRNSITGEASKALTELFSFNIPQRWSIAHLYQAILNGQEHVSSIAHITTLAGYIHYLLTGRMVLGIGDASGMFPIDSKTNAYDAQMTKKFDQLIEGRNYPWKLTDILPEVLPAGEDAGTLTPKGAKLLDVSGNLQPGILLCPPEGDAGTGMAATNSVAERTGNISAGTSVFAMIVLEDKLKKVYPEIDMVTTPSGSPVAMVHANNCTSDINAWIDLFGEFARCFGMDINRDDLFSRLFAEALKGDADGGGLLSYGYYSGENITQVTDGRPMFLRTPDSKFSLSNFMRTHLFSALGALKIGMDLLLKEENVAIDTIVAQGGFFTTPGVGQSIMAAALNTPISVMETAGEGGPWGMALLASYRIKKQEGESLRDFLAHRVFAGDTGVSMAPKAADVKGFEQFMERYRAGIALEREAAKVM